MLDIFANLYDYMDSVKKSVAHGIAWQGAAQWGCQLLSFGFYAGLARLLSPGTFGLVAIASVYLAFVQVFVNQGFGMAIIQRRNLELEHLDSAFWIAMATGVGFCSLSIAFASSIARMFGEPSVAPVIALLSLFFPLGALASTPTAILTRELNFRPLAIRSLIGTGVGGVVGLTMAFLGWGVWSLVGQQLVGATVGCICLWASVPWRPGLRVSKHHLRDLYGFSVNVVGTDVLWFFAQKSDQTMVGYGFGSSGMGPYSLASRLSGLLHDGIIGPLQSVAFPTFSKLQSVPDKFEAALIKLCEMTSFVGLPVFGGLFVVAPEVVPCLFGSKWIVAVPILRILAVYGAVRVVLGFVNPIMLAKGRSGLSLLMEIVLASLTFLGCLVAVRWSPAAIALSLVVGMTIFGVFQVSIVSIKVLHVRPALILKTVLFPLCATLLMMLTVALVRVWLTRVVPVGVALAVCVGVGVIVYVATACAIRRDLVFGIWGMATSVLPHRQAQSVASVVDVVTSSEID